MQLSTVFRKIPNCVVCGSAILELPIDEAGYPEEQYESAELEGSDFVRGVDQLLDNKLYVFCCDSSYSNTCAQMFQTCPTSYEDKGIIINDTILLSFLEKELNDDEDNGQ